MSEYLPATTPLPEQPPIATEHVIASIWTDVLGIPGPLQMTDSFFELGGESITMAMVLFQINEQLAIELPPMALVDNPLLRDFCAFVDSVRTQA